MQRTVLYLVLFLIPCSVVSQQSLADVDRKDVRYKKVRRFIKRQIKNQCNRIIEIQNTASQLIDIEFITHEQVMSTNLGVDELWDSYVHSDPSITWSDKKQSIAMMIDRGDKGIHYPGEFDPGVQVGQIYYYNLQILGRFFQLATAFEITEINHEKHRITYSYIEGGKTVGTQSFILKDDGNGGTLVYHTSNFSTKTKIRSRVLYPYFHTKLIKALHHRVWDYTYAAVVNE